MSPARKMVNQVKALQRASWLDLALGTLLILAPILAGVTGPIFWTPVAIGCLILVVAGWDAWAGSHARLDQVAGPTWLLLLAGLFTALYAVLAEGPEVYVWSLILIGGLLFVSAVYAVGVATRLQTQTSG